jgi:hypothetical protein
MCIMGVKKENSKLKKANSINTNPDEPEPHGRSQTGKNFLVSGFYESPGSKKLKV